MNAKLRRRIQRFKVALAMGKPIPAFIKVGPDAYDSTMSLIEELKSEPPTRPEPPKPPKCSRN